MGAFADAAFEEEVVRLGNGDTLVMFTDGVPEARNARGEEFGEIRLTACLSVEEASGPPALLSRIFGAIRTFCDGADQNDDVTVTVTRRMPASVIPPHPGAVPQSVILTLRA